MYMASLMALAKLFSSLPIIWKFSIDVSWLLLFWCPKIGDGVFLYSLNLSPNVTTVAANDTVLTGHAIFIFWWHKDVLECMSSLEMYSYSMLSTYVLYTFTYALYIWYHNVSFLAECLYVGVCFFLSLLFFSCCCWKIFLIAHLGYLNWPSASSRCCNSLSSNWWVKHMLCALCVKVLITLYKLWLLSNRRYKSVCMGFLYTPMVKVPSVSSVMMVSKKGMVPSSSDSSTVNWMEGPTKLMCWRIICVIGVELQKYHQHTSSISLEVQCCWDGSVLKGIHVDVGHYEAEWEV